MRYLSHIMEERQSELFTKQKVFFAFNNEQFKEGMSKHNLSKEIIIAHMGAGMYCPKANAKTVHQQLGIIYKESIQEDMKQGKDKVILRELSNHECFYTGNIDDCVHKLSDYPITEEEIIKVYHKNYSKMTEWL